MPAELVLDFDATDNPLYGQLQAITEFMELAMKDAFEQIGQKQREVGEFIYAAQSWARERRVFAGFQKHLYAPKGAARKH